MQGYDASGFNHLIRLALYFQVEIHNAVVIW